MTVKELREFLKKFPADMVVITSRYSDYKIVEPDEWNVIDADVSTAKGGWIRRYHEDLPDFQKQKVLHLEGN